MRRLFVLALFCSSMAASAHGEDPIEPAVHEASEIQKDMLASRYDAGEQCSDLYDKNKAKILSCINYYKRTLPKKPARGSSSEPYTLYGYLLGLKGRCEKNRGSVEEAFDQLEIALDLSRQNKSTDERALGFVAKVIKGFMDKNQKGALKGGFGMERAARGTFDRFKPSFEEYFKLVPEARRDPFMGPRIQNVYQMMLAL